MEPINQNYNEDDVKAAIAKALENFYGSLIAKIDAINIKDIMKSKNPYLYRAKSMQTSAEIIDSILQAFVSSSEETIFGNCFFEPIALSNLAVAISISFVISSIRTSIQSKISLKSSESLSDAVEISFAALDNLDEALVSEKVYFL